MKSVSVKRGDTFLLRCRWEEADGSPRPLSFVSVASWLKRGFEILPLVVNITNVGDGAFTLSIPMEDIDDLRAGNWLCDVEFTKSGLVESTETFSVIVIPDITNAP